MRVRDDPLHPDPGFAELYAALPEPDDLWPWLDWCRDAEPPVLYLGIGAGRLAAPLCRAGAQIVGVDAHPGMLHHLRRRIPGVEAHQALIETLDLGRRFDLVIAPSSILTAALDLVAAVRHLRPGGRIGIELMNPAWLASARHNGVRVRGSALEVDYLLPDGSRVVQVVDGWKRGPTLEAMRRRLGRLGLDVLWSGGRPGSPTRGSPTYFVLAGLPPSARTGQRQSAAAARR